MNLAQHISAVSVLGMILNKRAPLIHSAITVAGVVFVMEEIHFLQLEITRDLFNFHSPHLTPSRWVRFMISNIPEKKSAVGDGPWGLTVIRNSIRNVTYSLSFLTCHVVD